MEHPYNQTGFPGLNFRKSPFLLFQKRDPFPRGQYSNTTSAYP